MIMINYTKESLFDLKRSEQLKILKRIGIKTNKSMKEHELIDLILKSNMEEVKMGRKPKVVEEVKVVEPEPEPEPVPEPEPKPEPEPVPEPEDVIPAHQAVGAIELSGQEGKWLFTGESMTAKDYVNVKTGKGITIQK